MDATKETKVAFAAAISTAYIALGKDAPKPEVMATFFDLMADYSLEQVKNGLRMHMRDPERGHIAPVPADIIRHIPARRLFLSPNEAWSIGLRSTDEVASVCWCEEIAKAMGSAQPILQAGDEVGARMAFIETYRRLVAEAEAAGRGPVWSMSYGEDQHMRIEAERRAVSEGLLPPPAAAPDAKRLAAPAGTRMIPPDELRQRMRSLAESLKLKDEVRQREKVETESISREDFEARKRKAIEDLGQS